MTDPARVRPAAGLTRGLSLFIILLIIASAVYAAWIALRNWNDIGV